MRRRLANYFCEGLGAHAVLNGKHAGLEALARLPMASLGGMGGDCARLLCKFKIGVTGAISGLHEVIARKRRRDAKFLLAPIEIGERVAGFRFDKTAQP